MPTESVASSAPPFTDGGHPRKVPVNTPTERAQIATSKQPAVPIAMLFEEFRFKPIVKPN